MREREKVIERLYGQIKKANKEHTMSSGRVTAQSDRGSKEGPFADLMKLNDRLTAEASEAAKKDFREEKLKDAMTYKNIVEDFEGKHTR